MSCSSIELEGIAYRLGQNDAQFIGNVPYKTETELMVILKGPNSTKSKTSLHCYQQYLRGLRGMPRTV